MIDVVNKDTREQIEKCFKMCESSVVIVSPFLSEKAVDMLCELCSLKPEIDCIFVTRLYLNDFLKGVNSLQALSKLLNAGVKVYALRGLHAKLYLFDDETAIVGSANFTVAGLSKNFELSILTDEESVIAKVSLISDEIIKYCEENTGRVTEELLSQIMDDYNALYAKQQKDKDTTAYKTYGAEAQNIKKYKSEYDWKKAEFDIQEKDPVYDVLLDRKRENFKHNAWAKFEGSSDSRQLGNEKPSLSKVTIDGKESYIVNFRNRPSGIQTGDRIFIVANTRDVNGKSSAIIVGRGIAKAYINKCKVQKEWIDIYPWMYYYRYFCEITDLELINQNRQDCIPLSQVYDELGKSTYTSTIDKDEVKNMTLCQCRRSHIKMTQDAMEYVNNEIDKRIEQYGLV